MKKCLSLILSVLLAAFFPFSAFAEGNTGDLVKVLMSTPGVTVGRSDDSPSAQELDDAAEAGSELVPEGSKLTPGRITLLHTGTLRCQEEVYDVTFKVWSTRNRTIGLFFLAEDEEDWQLITCNQGDVIEGRFTCSGTFAIAVGW